MKLLEKLLKTNFKPLNQLVLMILGHLKYNGNLANVLLFNLNNLSKKKTTMPTLHTFIIQTSQLSSHINIIKIAVKTIFG